MANRVQFVRHIASAAATFVGRVGEITVNLTRSTIHVHDGATAGGVETARSDLSNSPDATASVAGRMSAADKNNLDTHIADATNPHAVTKTQVGLANVSNDAQLKAASNLSDLADAAAARVNLVLATVAQAEAEAGTATTTRAWTAERVKQAILALAAPAFAAATGLWFYQAAAPTGWTAVAGATDHGLKCAASGGSWPKRPRGWRPKACNTCAGSTRRSSAPPRRNCHLPPEPFRRTLGVWGQ